MSFFWFVPTPFKELLGRGGGEEGRRELSFFSFELRWAARGCACAMCFKRTGRWPTSSSSPRRQPPLPASPPAASASRFPASSLRFPAGSLRFPASSDGDSRTLSPISKKKKKTAKDAPTRARRASRRRRPGAGRRARCGCRCRRRRACGRASGGLSSFFTPFFCFFGFRDSEFSLLPLCPFPSSTFSLSFLPTLALLPSARALELASTCL